MKHVLHAAAAMISNSGSGKLCVAYIQMTGSYVRQETYLLIYIIRRYLSVFLLLPELPFNQCNLDGSSLNKLLCVAKVDLTCPSKKKVDLTELFFTGFTVRNVSLACCWYVDLELSERKVCGLSPNEAVIDQETYLFIIRRLYWWFLGSVRTMLIESALDGSV